MANLGDRYRRSDGRVAEKFVPASDWTQDDKGHYLFVDLPGFRKEELRLELAGTGHIIISGERIVNENKSIYFHQTFPLPEDSDTDKINGKFDGDFLHVTVPRRSVVAETKQEEESSKNGNANIIGEKPSAEEEEEEANNNNCENQSKHDGQHGDDGQHCDNLEKPEIKKGTCRLAGFPLEIAMKFLKENKGVVLSVVTAFLIGMLVCRTSETSPAE